MCHGHEVETPFLQVLTTQYSLFGLFLVDWVPEMAVCFLFSNFSDLFLADIMWYPTSCWNLLSTSMFFCWFFGVSTSPKHFSPDSLWGKWHKVQGFVWFWSVVHLFFVFSVLLCYDMLRSVTIPVVWLTTGGDLLRCFLQMLDDPDRDALALVGTREDAATHQLWKVVGLSRSIDPQAETKIKHSDCSKHLLACFLSHRILECIHIRIVS